MGGPAPRTIAVTLDGSVARADVAGLCTRVTAELAAGSASVVVCQLARATPCLATIDALARLQLATRRHGARLELHGMSIELRRLLVLTGLLGTLPC